MSKRDTLFFELRLKSYTIQNTFIDPQAYASAALTDCIPKW